MVCASNQDAEAEEQDGKCSKVYYPAMTLTRYRHRGPSRTEQAGAWNTIQRPSKFRTQEQADLPTNDHCNTTHLTPYVVSYHCPNIPRLFLSSVGRGLISRFAYNSRKTHQLLSNPTFPLHVHPIFSLNFSASKLTTAVNCLLSKCNY